MFFVYKTTNIVNGKFYIGVHSGSIDDNYLGSGIALRRAILKYGRDNFKREILEIFECKQAAYKHEELLVGEELVHSNECYNLKSGGYGGWSHVDSSGDKNPMKNHLVRAKVALAIAASYTPVRRLENSKRMKVLRSQMLVQPRSGISHTAESRALMSEKLMGRKAWNAGLKMPSESVATKEKKKLAACNRIANGFDMGSLSRGKQYNMQTVICPYCNKVGSGGNMTRYHFDNCRIKK